MTDENTLPVEPAEAAPEVPAVEPPAESAPVEQAPTPDDAGPPPVEDKVPDSVQKRIDKAIGKMREQERRTAALEARNDELIDLLMNASVLKAPAEQQTVGEPKRPTLAEFEYDEAKYEAALDQYLEAKAERVVERKLSTLQSQAQHARVLETYDSRATAFAAEVDDFVEVTNDPTLPISQPMAAVIRASEVGPALYYHLAKNREAALQIAKLPPELAAYELGKIETRINQPKTPPPARPKVTSAPPPPPSIEAADPAVEKDPGRMTDAEFARWRKRQIAQRR